MKNIAIVDLSWEMHREKESLKMLSVKRKLPSGAEVIIPTGHVYGTLQDIKHLSENYSLVVLAVDSPCTKRKELLASYKSDRHTPTGDPFIDYNIFNDLRSILTLATSLYSNVYYIKELEMEADDIIASFLLDSNTNLERNYSVFMRDKDILQTRGRYVWYDAFSKPPVDRVAYIAKSSGMSDSTFDYFPLPVKVITGDASDKIPNRIPRFPKDYLLKVCQLVPEDNYLFEPILEALISVREEMSPTWKGKLAMLENPDSDLVKGLYLNYQMVVPIHKPVKELKYKQLKVGSEEILALANSYQLTMENL